MAESSNEIKQDCLWEKELYFVQKLKRICKDGKETNPNESAAIFHQMGLIYKEKAFAKSRNDETDNPTGQMIDLIRSVVLLNAAIVRQHSNLEFKKDLKELCFELLKLARAKRLSTDLENIANEAAKKIKKMREKTNRTLMTVEVVSFDINKDEQTRMENDIMQKVKSMQDEITDNYRNVMKYISGECEKIMGEVPCKYAVTGMGSLARKEITPYSDFEHIILLEEGVQENHEIYIKVLQYFRWFCVIFQIIVINLKETIIPSVAIPSLNDSTKPNSDWFFDSQKPRGISFDGLMPHACKLPLGRMEKTKKKPWTTELIKPVSDMLKYLDCEENLKNGYHLSDLLTRTCFVSGTENIYECFTQQVTQRLDENEHANNLLLMKELNEDLKNFDPFNTLLALVMTSKCNIKRVVYRSSSLFISALGRIYSIKEASSFMIIHQLKVKEIINDETAHQLAYAIAIACLCRLRVYMLNESQDDYIGQDDLYDPSNNKVTAELVSIVGEKSMVDYFIIVYGLQKMFRNAGDLQEVEVNLTLNHSTKFRILYLLQLFDRLFIEWENYLLHKPKDSSHEDELWIKCHIARAYYFKGRYDISLSMWKELGQQDIKDPSLQKVIVSRTAWCFNAVGKYQEGIKYVEEVKQVILDLDIPEDEKYDQLSGLAHMKSWCNYSLSLYRDAIRSCREALEYCENSDVPWKAARTSECYSIIGSCLYQLEEYDLSIAEVEVSLQICQHGDVPVNETCRCHRLLGCCRFKKAEYTVALQHFQTELALRLQFVPNDKEDVDESIKQAKN